MLRFEHNRIVVSISVRCTAEEAWRVLIDTQYWPRWGPSVARVSCSQRCIGSGSSGRIKTSLGFWVPFTITDYRELQFWSWRIGLIPATGHRLSENDDGTCSVAFDMPWWTLPYLVVCRIALSRIKRLLAEPKNNATSAL